MNILGLILIVGFLWLLYGVGKLIYDLCTKGWSETHKTNAHGGNAFMNNSMTTIHGQNNVRDSYGNWNNCGTHNNVGGGA